MPSRPVSIVACVLVALVGVIVVVVVFSGRNQPPPGADAPDGYTPALSHELLDAPSDNFQQEHTPSNYAGKAGEPPPGPPPPGGGKRGGPPAGSNEPSSGDASSDSSIPAAGEADEPIDEGGTEDTADQLRE